MAELLGDPANALAGCEGAARVGVARAVELERSHSGFVCAAPDAPPRALEVVRVDRPSAAYALLAFLPFDVLGLGAEDPLGHLGPAPSNPLLAAQRENIEQRGREARRHRDRAALAALRRRGRPSHDGSADRDPAALEVDVFPLEAEQLAAPDTARE